jgi:hypothetical protein
MLSAFNSPFLFHFQKKRKKKENKNAGFNWIWHHFREYVQIASMQFLYTFFISGFVISFGKAIQKCFAHFQSGKK